jgi:LysM repeat protein
MVEAGLIAAPVHYVFHLARRGDTLGKLAKRYGTTIREIQRVNGLRSTLIQAKKRYRIPQPGPAPSAETPVAIPPRRLPPRRRNPRSSGHAPTSGADRRAQGKVTVLSVSTTSPSATSSTATVPTSGQ